MRRFGIATLLICSFLVLTGAVFQRHALACEFLPVLNYQQINSAVFIGPEISEKQAKIIKGLIGSASERISDVYGQPISEPRFLFASDTEMAIRWGANETASMYRMPWKACIVIGPKGKNVDVIAHEWLHAEIQQRVGFFRFLNEIPIWFDEGSALTVDYREPFLPANIDLTYADIRSVKSLKSGTSFFTHNAMQNYQAARLAVEPLIRDEHFFNDLGRISSGESFEHVFLNPFKSTQPTLLKTAGKH